VQTYQMSVVGSRRGTVARCRADSGGPEHRDGTWFSPELSTSEVHGEVESRDLTAEPRIPAEQRRSWLTGDAAGMIHRLQPGQCCSNRPCWRQVHGAAPAGHLWTANVVHSWSAGVLQNCTISLLQHRWCVVQLSPMFPQHVNKAH